MTTTYRFGVLFALFLCAVTAGCSDNAPSPYTGKGDLELHISPGSSSGGATKGGISFAKGTASGKYTEIWKGRVGQDNRIELEEPHYYPEDNSRIYLRGFAPEGKSFADGCTRFTIDGKTDLIASNEQNGCLTDMFRQTQKEFRFIHLLSQLRFKVCCDEEASGKDWKLVELYVEGMQSEVSLSLADLELTFSGDKKNITVPVEPTPLSEAWADLPGRVLIQPGERIFLTAVVADAGGRKTKFEHLLVTIHEGGGTPVGGTSYLISLKLRAKGSTLVSAGIGEWVQGSSGSVVI